MTKFRPRRIQMLQMLQRIFREVSDLFPGTSYTQPTTLRVEDLRSGTAPNLPVESKYRTPVTVRLTVGVQTSDFYNIEYLQSKQQLPPPPNRPHSTPLYSPFLSPLSPMPLFFSRSFLCPSLPTLLLFQPLFFILKP